MIKVCRLARVVFTVNWSELLLYSHFCCFLVFLGFFVLFFVCFFKENFFFLFFLVFSPPLLLNENLHTCSTERT